jgi:hypothetical protein
MNLPRGYSQVQFRWPGALAKYNEYMETVDAATKEQKELQAQ